MSGDLAKTSLALPDGDALLIEGFIEPSRATGYLDRLLADVAWEQHQIRIFGRREDPVLYTQHIGDPHPPPGHPLRCDRGH